MVQLMTVVCRGTINRLQFYFGNILPAGTASHSSQAGNEEKPSGGVGCGRTGFCIDLEKGDWSCGKMPDNSSDDSEIQVMDGSLPSIHPTAPFTLLVAPCPFETSDGEIARGGAVGVVVSHRRNIVECISLT